jgi:hypothetical protein
MLKITLKKQSFDKNPNTKTTYLLRETETEEISEKQYANIVESASFFRRLGGSVFQQRAHTCYGYKVVKDTATSPDKQTKTVRTFNFEYI